uniref:Esterase-like protein n=1 Tax=Tetraselmis sp. GSL018 TaxID=582737 RepID=A0A061QNI5_9CHLO
MLSITGNSSAFPRLTPSAQLRLPSKAAVRTVETSRVEIFERRNYRLNYLARKQKRTHSPRVSCRVNLSQKVFATTSSSTSERSMHALPDGKRLEVIYRKADGGGSRPPLVFIHGSYHAAWCWEEHFMPFFSERGYDCYALSLRAQGGSDPIEGNVAGTVQSLAEDIASFVGSLDRPPVVIGHSFGGLPVQWLVAAGRGRRLPRERPAIGQQGHCWPLPGQDPCPRDEDHLVVHPEELWGERGGVPHVLLLAGAPRRGPPAVHE